jgi:hypothetical protein
MGIVPSVVSIFTGGLSSSKPQEPVKFMNISVFNDPMASYINELSHPSNSNSPVSSSEQNNNVLIYGSIAILILYFGLS